ncbi:unnamed protein product [Vitrella brassicaformis CCMP3155]|uniref:Uncharacterized protein n=1 Tax=Vitrella brassicaformis (strain CCMP3155) TaxID=1169540 RepID=A0A0G4EL36_VITBC|nr:unnamed protein product [Vitrella brassicaformis CCMP3155]|eukprot:CEL97106.1 unnamed protein product [Vitrella brassicaformis CCMP3155]
MDGQPMDVDDTTPGGAASKRVKLYELDADSGAWKDRGTGHVICDTYGREFKITVKGEEQGNLLLNSIVDESHNYTHQKDTIITWQEPKRTGGADAYQALSFQQPAGCHEVWSFIQRAIQPHSHPDASHTVPLSVLPLPSLDTLNEICNHLENDVAFQAKREQVIGDCMNATFLDKLYRVFEDAEDLELRDKLTTLWHIVKKMVMTCSKELINLLLDDEHYEKTFGILEHDEGIPDDRRIRHRSYIKDNCHLVEPVQIADNEFRKQIHLHFRLCYLKDVALARVLDDQCLAIISNLAGQQQLDLLAQSIDDSKGHLAEIFKALPDNYDALLWINSLVAMCRQMMPNEKSQLFNALNQRHIFEALEEYLRKSCNGYQQWERLMALEAKTREDQQRDHTGQPHPLSSGQGVTDGNAAAGSAKTDEQHSSGQMSVNGTPPAAAAAAAAAGGGGGASSPPMPVSKLTYGAAPHPTVAHVLQRPSTNPVSAAVEIIQAAVTAMPGLYRNFLKQRSASSGQAMVGGGGRTSMETDTDSFALLCRLMIENQDQGIQSQLGEVLRHVLDTSNMEQPEKDDFLTLFYEKGVMEVLIEPILRPKTHFHTQSEEENYVFAKQQICEILAFIVKKHSYRIKYYILRVDLAKKVMQLAKAREKHLVLAAIRFIRAIVDTKDAFYYRYFAKNDVLRPMMELLRDQGGLSRFSGGMGNLLESAILELFKFIHCSNPPIKELITYLGSQYEDLLKQLADRAKLTGNTKIYEQLLIDWEKCKEVEEFPPKTHPLGRDTSAMDRDSDSISSRRLAREDEEQDAWLEQDDEDVQSPNQPNIEGPIVEGQPEQEPEITTGTAAAAAAASSPPQQPPSGESAEVMNVSPPSPSQSIMRTGMGLGAAKRGPPQVPPMPLQQQQQQQRPERTIAGSKDALRAAMSDYDDDDEEAQAPPASPPSHPQPLSTAPEGPPVTSPQPPAAAPTRLENVFATGGGPAGSRSPISRGASAVARRGAGVITMKISSHRRISGEGGQGQQPGGTAGAGGLANGVEGREGANGSGPMAQDTDQRDQSQQPQAVSPGLSLPAGATVAAAGDAPLAAQEDTSMHSPPRAAIEEVGAGLQAADTDQSQPHHIKKKLRLEGGKE